jgi:alkylation response protein AidB-like acyl-CoA dehydrogenase
LREIAQLVRDAEATSPGSDRRRERLGELHERVEGAIAVYRRSLARPAAAGASGGYEALIKLVCTELGKEIAQFGIELQGEAGADVPDRVAGVRSWTHEYLTSFMLTLGGGTSEIQRNLIAERLLGLPKDLPAEHMKGGAR